MALDDTYSMRVNKKEAQSFRKHCTTKLGIPHQDITREMHKALVEGRLTITRPEEHREALEALYK